MKISLQIVIILGLIPFLLRAAAIKVPEDQPTIQAGINAASYGDTVLVADGTYHENINFKGKSITVASYFIMDLDTSHIDSTINGSQPSHPDSGSTVSFISGERATSILSGFTISGGSGTTLAPVLEDARGGGGIFCWNAGPTITHNLIIDNVIDSAPIVIGGGIMASADIGGFYISIENNVIKSNSLEADSVAVGGGIHVGFYSLISGNKILQNTVTSRLVAAGSGVLGLNLFANWGNVDFNNNIVSQNQSVAGAEAYGAVYFEFSDVVVEHNTIKDNTLNSGELGWGTGLIITETEGNSRVVKNTITNNKTISGECRGGGILTILTFDLRIQENQIKNNLATYGAGIGTWYSSPTIQGNLIVKNKAKEGAGVWINWFPFDNQPATIKNHFGKMSRDSQTPVANSRGTRTFLMNNTIADNEAMESGGGVSTNLGSAEIMNSIIWNNTAPADSQIKGVTGVSYSNVQGGYNGLGNLNQDPLFSDTTDYYLSPSVSPVIDAGNPHTAYNDIEDPNNPGLPLFPALGTLRNDMGAYGGNPDVTPQIPLIFGSQFRAFKEQVEAAQPGERPAIVDSFMSAVPSFPFIEEGKFVYFLYRGSTNSVNVPGDANNWNTVASPMTRLSDTNLFYWQDIFEPDARLDYKFVLNGSNWILDPLNPRTVLGGFGPNSELVMPAYVDSPEIEYYQTIPHGTLHDTTVHSNILNNSRLVRIYTPPSYSNSLTDSFPVILFHDGLEYISLASANNTLDYLIANNRIEPIIAVFVPPVDRDNEYAFNTTQQFESFIISELMPAIDSRFRTMKNPSKRAMTGPSFGGLITTQICYNNPDEFGLPAPYSPAYWPKDGEIFWQAVNGPVEDLKWYIDWGTYEAGIMLDGRAFRDFMTAKGYPMEWKEWHEGHSWGSWRAHLDNALEYFFPGSALAVHNELTIPSEFQLWQNYPNPFNPTTTIRYDLVKATKVVLTVYNLLGQEIIKLVDEDQSPGQKKIEWNGRNNYGHQVASGIYIYRLQAGENIAVRKMVFVK
jgi:enterochelin esterase family protein